MPERTGKKEAVALEKGKGKERKGLSSEAQWKWKWKLSQVQAPVWLSAECVTAVAARLRRTCAYRRPVHSYQ